MSENTPSPSPVTNEIISLLETLESHVQDSLDREPKHFSRLKTSLRKFFACNGVVKTLRGAPKAPTLSPAAPTFHPLQKEILSMKESLTALSKTVASLQSPRPQPATPNPKPKGQQSNVKTLAATSHPTYAILAASPPCPSAVVGLGGLPSQDKLSHTELCSYLNNALAQSPELQVHIAAVRWTVCGNLVVTAGHNTLAQQLQQSLHLIATLIRKKLAPSRSADPPIRANVKWSRILLNRVPTGISVLHGAFTPDECHVALAAENPFYASLQITQ